MSIKIMDMVADRIVGKTDKKPNGNQTEKNLLMAMANYASDNGEGIWASNQCLADRAGVSRETATRTVKSLKDKGLIERLGIKKYGKTHTVIYRMDLTVLYHLDLTETAKNHLERMAVNDVTERHNDTVNDVMERHNDTVNDVTERHNDTVNDVTEDHNDSERCDARDVSDVTERHTNRYRNHIYNISLNAHARTREGDRHLVDRIREAYDGLSDKHNLPGIKVFGDSRKRLIRARLKDAGGNEDLLFEVMHKVADSDYCRGLVNGWKADFNFIFSPEGFPKILEGKYDNDRNIRNPKGHRPNFGTSKASAIRARERDKRHQAARKLDAELGFN